MAQDPNNGLSELVDLIEGGGLQGKDLDEAVALADELAGNAKPTPLVDHPPKQPLFGSLGYPLTEADPYAPPADLTQEGAAQWKALNEKRNGVAGLRAMDAVAAQHAHDDQSVVDRYVSDPAAAALQGAAKLWGSAADLLGEAVAPLAAAASPYDVKPEDVHRTGQFGDTSFLPSPSDPRSLPSTIGGFGGMALGAIPASLAGGPTALAGLFGMSGAGQALTDTAGMDVSPMKRAVYVTGSGLLNALLGMAGPAGASARAATQGLVQELGQGALVVLAYNMGDYANKKLTIEPDAQLDPEEIFKQVVAGEVVGGVSHAVAGGPVADPAYEQALKDAGVTKTPEELRAGTLPKPAIQPSAPILEQAAGEVKVPEQTPVPAAAEAPAEWIDTGGSGRGVYGKEPAATEPPVSTREAGAGTQTEPLQKGDGSKLVGIKNAAADAQAAFYGDEPPKHGEGIISRDMFEEARKKLEADPLAGQKLVDDLTEKPRSASKEDTALLANEIVRLTNERDAAGEAYKNDPSEENLARRERAAADYKKAQDAYTVAGTEQSQSFGLRRWMLKNDYSVANLEYEQLARNEGIPLSEEQHAYVDKVAAEYKAKSESLAKQEAALKEREAKVAADEQMKAAGVRVKRKQPSATTKWLTVKADEARARMKARLHQANVGFDPAAIGDLAIIAAEHVSKGLDAAAELVREFGDVVKPHLDEIIEKAKAVPVERFKEAMKGKELNRLRPLILKLQDHFYSSGIHDTDAMIDAIHGVLKEVKPEITRTEAMHLLGGYGDFKPLDKTPSAVGKREQRVNAQLWSKLDALLNKNPLLKSGVERPELTAEQRADLKKINRLKKELGIGALDPETQLKSTLEANKTRYRNSMEDMQRQIDNLEADQVANGPSPTDAELEQLKADHAKKKAEFEDIFGKPGLSDAERLSRAATHAEKAAIEAEAKVKIADIAVRKKEEVQGPPTAEVDALRQKLEAARSRRDAAQAELRFLRRTNEENVIAGLEKRIEKAKAGVKKATATGSTVDTAKVAALRAELADLQKQRDAKPPRDPYEVAKQASMTRMAHEAARLQEKAMYKDFSPRTKREPLPRDAAWEKAAAEFEQVKNDYARRKHEEELANRTNAEKFRSLAKDVLFEPARAIKTAWDLSAPGRQGIVFALSHPWITTTEHIPEMIKSFASEESAARTDAAIRRRPLAKLGDMAKLDLTNHGDTLTHREEEIASRVLRKIPGFKGSNRAYITFLNIQRSTMFDMMVQGHPEAMTLAKARAIAHAVNVGTGRGEARAVAPAMRIAAHVIWAPKLLLSRLQILTGEPMWQADSATRTQIAKEMYLRPLGSVAALLALGVMSGGKLETDSRSTDFLKLKFGNTRIDILGGLMQIPVMISKLLTGKTKDSMGRVTKDSRGAWDELTYFLRKKLAPVPSMAVDIAERKDVVGDPVTLTSEIKNIVTPLAWKDFFEAAQEEGIAKGALFGLMSIFGLGVQTYDPQQRKEKPGSFWR